MLQRTRNALSNHIPLRNSDYVYFTTRKSTALTGRHPVVTKARQYSRTTGLLHLRSRDIPRSIDTFKLPNTFQGHRQSRITELTKSYTRNYTNSNAAPTSFSDPSRPDLFYHLVHLNSATQPVFALSFLPIPPSSADSSTVIGWLPASTPQGEDEAGLNDFKQNSKFVNILHEAILAGLEEGVDDIQINGAMQLRDGWMHVHDDRNIPALGRIGDVDDILGSVLVRDGVIIANTYQPMPSYRVCTSDGLTQLTPGLMGKLVETLNRVATQESESS